MSIFDSLHKEAYVFLVSPTPGHTAPSTAEALVRQGCVYCELLGGWIASEDCENHCPAMQMFGECQV